MTEDSPDGRGRRRRDRPGMREVAERAGVAMSSVSRVLSGHPDVSVEMRQTVETAVRELGYRPDLLAQGLRSQQTFSVGFAVSDIANPVLADAITGAERRLRSAGYSLLLTDSEGNAEFDAAQIRILDQRRVDGFLLSLVDERHPQTAETLRSIDVPIVLLDRDRPANVEVQRVCYDHRKGMEDAAQHLVNLGHRDIALISGGPRRPARQRREGVEQALKRAGVDVGVTIVEGSFSVEHGYRATIDLLRRTPRPTAIIAGGNILMRGALRAIHERGVRIGLDISFVGCDDIAVAEFHDPPISVVRRDTRALGERAAELLLAAFGGTSAPSDVILPTEYVSRPSCAAPVRGKR